MNRKLLLILALSTSFAAAQQQVDMTLQQRRAPAPENAQPIKIAPEQRERAMQLLDSAEGQARGMKDAGSRAFALLQLGRAYKDTNKKKAAEIFEDALAATRAMDDDARFRRTRTRLQEQILDQLIPLAPDKIDDFLGQVDAAGRERVLLSLIRYYSDRKQTDKALETIYRIGQEFEIPYGAAANIMSSLTAEDSAEIQQLFTTALASYRDHEHEGFAFGTGDFGNLVTQFHTQLPPALVRQAINVLLDEARKRGAAKNSGQPVMSMSSAKGAIAFNSQYDFRLFQLMPVLKAIDPDEAEKLVKEHQDVQTLLAKYPKGLSSVAPQMAQPGQRQDGPPRAATSRAGSNMSYSMSTGGPGPGGRPPAQAGRPAGPPPQGGPNPLEMQRMAKILEDAAAHPHESIANTGTITTPSVRMQTYLGIARETWKKNSSAAKIAVGKASDTLADVNPDEQLMALREVADFYQRLEDTDNAKKTIERGIEIAEKLLKSDTNADDPNQAPKAYWPSTSGYRSMLALATRISPDWAVSLLKEIPDDDIKALNQIAIANALLQTRGGTMEIMQFTKNGGRMMMMAEERQDQ